MNSLASSSLADRIEGVGMNLIAKNKSGSLGTHPTDIAEIHYPHIP